MSSSPAPAAFLGRRVVLEFLRRGARRPGPGPAVRPRSGTSAGRPRWKSTGPDLLATEDLVPAFEGIDAVVHPRRRRPGDGTRNGTPPPWSAPSGSSTRWRRPGQDAWFWPAACRSTTGAGIEGTLDEESPLEPAADLAGARTATRGGQGRSGRGHPTDGRAARAGTSRSSDRASSGAEGNALPAGLGQNVGPIRLVFGPSTRPPLTHVRQLRPRLCPWRPRTRGRSARRSTSSMTTRARRPSTTSGRPAEGGSSYRSLTAWPSPGSGSPMRWPSRRPCGRSCRACWSPAGSRLASSRSGSPTASSARSSAGPRRSIRPSEPGKPTALSPNLPRSSRRERIAS